MMKSLDCMRFSLEVVQVNKVKAAQQCLFDEDDEPVSAPIWVHGDMAVKTFTYPVDEDRASGVTMKVTESMIDVQVFVDYTGRVGIPTV